MLTPYGLDLMESCLTCNTRSEELFCGLPSEALNAFETIKYPTVYPKGALLFIEGQEPRGIFVLCKGRVKLRLSAADGMRTITRIVESGEVLGLGATITGRPYELTAETLEPCQVTFVKRNDFLHLLKEHSEACFKATEQLSQKYNSTCHELQTLGLSHSAAQKLARLLMEWTSTKSGTDKQSLRLRLPLTHQEIGEMIGTTRETVTRILADFKRRGLVQVKGSTLTIRDRAALYGIAVSS